MPRPLKRRGVAGGRRAPRKCPPAWILTGFRDEAAAAFAAVAVGDSWAFARTFSEGDVAAFVAISGDWNPIHIDEAFSRSGPFKTRIVPGLLTGSMLTHIGGMLGWIATEIAFVFRLPVHIGNTIPCRFVIVERNEASRRFFGEATFTDEHGTVVGTGTLGGFPTRMRLLPERTAVADGTAGPRD